MLNCVPTYYHAGVLFLHSLHGGSVGHKRNLSLRDRSHFSLLTSQFSLLTAAPLTQAVGPAAARAAGVMAGGPDAPPGASSGRTVAAVPCSASFRAPVRAPELHGLTTQLSHVPCGVRGQGVGRSPGAGLLHPLLPWAAALVSASATRWANHAPAGPGRAVATQLLHNSTRQVVYLFPRSSSHLIPASLHTSAQPGTRLQHSCQLQRC